MNEETLSSSCLLSISSPPSNSLSSIVSPSPSPSSVSSPSPSTIPHSVSDDRSTIRRSPSLGFIPSIDPSDSFSSSPHSCYLTAEATINNIPGIVLLDTGSGVTIISSRHWSVIGSPDSVRPYQGPIIQGPDGSSIGPVGHVLVDVTMAGVTIQQPAILADAFHHLVLLGMDYMKTIGLVLDLQANKMWLRAQPHTSYPISSDLTQAGRLDVPVVSTENRSIAPYHMAFIQVHVPRCITSSSWDASISGKSSCVATANSLIRFVDRQSFVQVANCSSRPQYVHIGQRLALADLYFDFSDVTSPSSSSSPISSSSTSSASLIVSSLQSVDSSFSSDFLLSLRFDDSDLTSPQILELKQLLLQYHRCFRDQPGRTSLIHHHIDTGTTKPIKLRPYRVSPHRQQLISQQITQMLADDIIEHASGPYAAPVTLQPKKDGSLRFCVDFRQLNAVTIRDVYPLPRVDDTLDQLRDARYFTSLDLRSGFWQIELDHESRSKTAFVTHAGLFQFKVMPFGLTNAPATFQRLMDLVLGGLKWSCSLVYLDDIIVFSPSFDLHLQHLRSVLQRIADSDLTLQLSKCNFCKTKLKYLGHVVSKSGVEPDPDKISAVRDYPVPTRLKEVRMFLGLTGYYRRFIRNYSTIAEPLISLTRQPNASSFHWTPACQTAFDHLRHFLTTTPIISYPHFDQPFLLQLDSSDVGLSAILAQKLVDDDGIQREHVIGYASRTLSPAERRYSPTERECLAIVYGCRHFRPYLEGVRFTIVTDHKALKWLHQTKDINSRLARWAMQIAAYDVDIQHRPGSANANCDALSRVPLPSSSDLDSTPLLPDLILPRTSLQSAHNPLIDSFGSSTSSSSHIHLISIPFSSNVSLYDEIRTAQWQDSALLPLLNYLHTRQLPSDSSNSLVLALAPIHRLIDGALFRVLRSSSSSSTAIHSTQSTPDILNTSFSSQQSQLRLVVPQSKIRTVLSLAHDHATAAHLGRRKTLSRVSGRFIWPFMRRDVAAYVRSCPLCQQFKASNQLPPGLMHSTIVHEPWNTVGIDITGPLPKTRRGNVYILVIIDYFTKWIELFPMPNMKANTIAQIFVDDVICRFGFPVRVISDNGVQFLSSIFTNICTSFGITHQRTPLYHPQSNLSERVNRTLRPLLASLAYHDHRSWDLKLPQIAFALRTAPSDSTGQSPAFLMFGRHPRQALDFALPSPTTTDTSPTSTDVTNYRHRLLSTLFNTYSTTRELLDIARQRQTRNYNSHRRPLEFDVGDLVWVTPFHRISNRKWRGLKLEPRRDGPYKIITKLTSLTYELEHIVTHHRLLSIHVERLTPYYPPTATDLIPSSSDVTSTPSLTSTFPPVLSLPTTDP